MYSIDSYYKPNWLDTKTHFVYFVNPYYELGCWDIKKYIYGVLLT